MMQAEAQVFETEPVILTVNTQTEVFGAEEKKEHTENVGSTAREDIHKRFARLRKSLKKRSVNIL